MELINAKPLYVLFCIAENGKILIFLKKMKQSRHRVKKLKDPAAVYGQCMEVKRFSIILFLFCVFLQLELFFFSDES